MRPIDTLVIHCAATKPSMDIGAKEIREWHVKGNHWKDIGYHEVIRRDGTLEMGRPISQVGAHVAGHNIGSIGICLVGGVAQNDIKKAENNFTREQWDTLKSRVEFHIKNTKIKKIYGHRQLDNKKECPSFDVTKWLNDNGFARYA